MFEAPCRPGERKGGSPVLAAGITWRVFKRIEGRSGALVEF